tara:strand:- start:84 stop:1073 length:990 start_codon:yes stop_codon:yes gene_type:complete
MEKNRLLELDAIRGVAALAVVIYHYFKRYNDIYGHEYLLVEWASLGKYGVQLFFMVSGFVIYLTLNRVEKPADFLVSRFSRLYPTFWFSAILTFSVVFIWGLPGREVSIDQAIMNVFMFHQYMGIKHIDGVYWTLTIELTFYFWMFTFFVTGLLKYAEYLFALIILISILESRGVVEISGLVNKIFIVQYLSYFLAGICFYKILNEVESKITYVVLFLCLVSTLFLFSKVVFIITSVFYLFFYLAISGKLRFLTFKPLIFLGEISYSLYLLHQNIGYVIINELYTYGINPILSISVAICVSIVLAYFTTKYVEKPSLIAIRIAYRRVSA